MREFLEGGADIRRGLGRGPQLAEDHTRAQGLQKAIRFDLSARLEFGLTIFGELLAEGQGDGGNSEEHGRCADDLPRQDPRHGGQPGEAGEFLDQDEYAGRVRIATQDHVDKVTRHKRRATRGRRGRRGAAYRWWGSRRGDSYGVSVTARARPLDRARPLNRARPPNREVAARLRQNAVTRPDAARVLPTLTGTVKTA